MLILELSREIQVRTGDYKREWKDATVTSVVMEKAGVDESDHEVYGLSFSVCFADGCTQRVSDAFGWSGGEWRYKDQKGSVPMR